MTVLHWLVCILTGASLVVLWVRVIRLEREVDDLEHRHSILDVSCRHHKRGGK